jgi:Haem-binding domain
VKKFAGRALVVLLLGLILLQFWRPPRNFAAGASPNDIAAKYPVPADVAALLRRACYDCHSNRTQYPWYAAVQPVRWWLDSHINDGKRHLNFSEFAGYSAKRAKSKIGEVADEVDQRHMPLRSYTWMHPEARLTPEEIRLLVAWAEDLQENINP